MYEASYNAKDLILYALSLGMKSHEDDADELKFVYEDHPNFTAFPTFCLALPFLADEGEGRASSRSGTTGGGIPSFPPPLMAKEQILPRRFLRGDDATAIDATTFPVIHTWQSICWHSPLRVPDAPKEASVGHHNHVRTNIDLKTIAFVTTMSRVTTTTTTGSHNNSNVDEHLCTMQSTTLLLGISSDSVVPFDAGIPRLSCRPTIPKREPPIFQWSYRTTEAQALLYRLTSGDSNRIHVDPSALSELLLMSAGERKEAPLLHGLFTLALALRAIFKMTAGGENGNRHNAVVVARRLEGKFTHPAFVGDTLCVRVWNAPTDGGCRIIGGGTAGSTSIDRAASSSQADANKWGRKTTIPKCFFFVVINQETGSTLVDCGYAEVEVTIHTTETPHSRL
jgi:peroxisomal enoyl-CoA hydratase 2